MAVSEASVEHTSIALNNSVELDADNESVATQMSSPAESALISSLCNGDESAYEALIDRFERPVYNLVAHLTDDRDDAADMTQEVFLKFFRTVASFRGGCSLKTWIYRIAVNEARNHRRWFSRHRRKEVAMESSREDQLGSIDWVADPGRSPLQVTLDHESEERVENALAEVNPSYRAALVLREVEGLSYEEISQIMDISLGTVKSRIVRGREDLREKLARQLQPPSSKSERIWKQKTWKGALAK